MITRRITSLMSLAGRPRISSMHTVWFITASSQDDIYWFPFQALQNLLHRFLWYLQPRRLTNPSSRPRSTRTSLRTRRHPGLQVGDQIIKSYIYHICTLQLIIMWRPPATRSTGSSAPSPGLSTKQLQTKLTGKILFAKFWRNCFNIIFCHSGYTGTDSGLCSQLMISWTEYSTRSPT